MTTYLPHRFARRRGRHRFHPRAKVHQPNPLRFLITRFAQSCPLQVLSLSIIIHFHILSGFASPPHHQASSSLLTPITGVALGLGEPSAPLSSFRFASNFC